MPFDPVHILIFISMGLSFYAFQTYGRKRMLSFKVFADALFGIYLLLLGGTTGAFSAWIAMLGGIVQIATPPHLTKKSLPYRLIIACVLSIIGAYFLSKNMSDIYPFIGVIISRFVEIFNSTLILRIGFFCAAIPWLAYNFTNEYYLAVLAGLLMMTGMIIGIFKNERRLPKDPVP